MARMSLADTLKDIANVRPTLDPEDEEERTLGEQNEEATAHYLATGSSSLRTSSHLEADPRYKGKAVSRKSLLQESDESQGDREEVSVDAEESEEGSDSDLDETQGDGPSSEDSEEEDEQPRASTSATFGKDERAMLQQLKQAASADIEKGRDVRKQLALWDTLLEGRIRLQKVLSLLSTLPQPAAYDDYRDENADELDTTLSSLEKLSDSLFSLRERLLSANSTVQPPARKRRRTSDFDFDSALADLKALNAAFQPHLRATVTKWSDKVSAASAQNRFIDRNTWSQIEQTVSNDGEKLIARTRRSRTGDNAAADAVEDPEVFDDGDFYQQLLKDVVESRSLDLDDGTLASLRSAGQDRTKRRKVVDTKASKGRKLRYHVHEKLVHFMAPQPQPIPPGGHLWHDEQARELFASLLGKGFTSHPETAPMAVNGTSDGGTLRIFG